MSRWRGSPATARIARDGAYRAGMPDARRASASMVAFFLVFAVTVFLDFMGGAALFQPLLSGHFVAFPAFVVFLGVFLASRRDKAVASPRQGDTPPAAAGSLARRNIAVSVAARASPADPAVGESVDNADAIGRYGISPREVEVLRLLGRGYTYREVADELCVSLATVKSHATHLYDKTGSRNKVELLNLRILAPSRAGPP